MLAVTERWRIVHDSDRHRYIIPADRLKEFYYLDSQIADYWEDTDHGDKTGLASEFPPWAVRIDGTCIELGADTLVGGRPIGEIAHRG